MGAWFGYGLGSENKELPAFIVLNGGLIPLGGLDNFNSGFLPAAYQGSVFAVVSAGGECGSTRTIVRFAEGQAQSLRQARSA